MLISHGLNGHEAAVLARAPAMSGVDAKPRSWNEIYVLALGLVDVAAAMTAALAALLIRPAPDGPVRALVLALSVSLGWVVALAAMRLYHSRNLGVGAEEFRRVCQAGTVLAAFCGILAYATGTPVARGFLLVALPLTVALDLAARYSLRRALHAQRARGRCMDTVVLVGTHASARSLAENLATDSSHGLRVVGACLVDADQCSTSGNGLAILGGLADLVPVVNRTGADKVVIIAGPETSGPALRQIAWSMEGTRAALVVAPGLVEVATPRVSIRPVAGLSLLQLEQPEFTGGRRLVKEAVDRSLALLALVLLMPVFLLIGLAIRLDRCGPGLYRQPRIGIHGRPFTLFKFRTMCAGAEDMHQGLMSLNELADGPLFKIRADPRVTRLGRVMRRYSLDELPQLINILRGEMSLVGPRPPLPGEVAQYGSNVHRRLLVKPGLTGLWQVSGRSDLSWEDSVRLDLSYVDNWSPGLDLLILWRTFRSVLSGSGAY